jgi:RHS repeat-associated protein
MNTQKILSCILILIAGGGHIAFGQASSSQNYIMTNTVKQAGITNEGMIPGLPVATQGKSQSIAYFDGLGRPLQTVITQGSATQKDIIVGNEYDAFGRETKKYLPYADISNTISPGSYKPGWTATQAGFYNGQLQGVDIDAAPYSQSVLEASPLNRLLAQGAPGTVWQPGTDDNLPYDGTKKTIQVHYEINLATDNIRIFNVDMNTGAISSDAVYGDGLLTVKRSLDEHQGVTKEFTDKSGHLILKQVYIENGDILQTYYIYDDLDLLRAVIQPEGVAKIPASGSWTPDAQYKSNWMFLYTYDSRNRMISKQVPGAKTSYMAYDQWDRLVATQDGNMHANSQWLFTKYDALNRPIITGMITEPNPVYLQYFIDNAPGRYETVSVSAPEGYTLNSSFPNVYALTIYTITHYDSYSNLPSWSSAYSFVPENTVTSKNDNLQGQVVATQTRILNTNNWMRSVNYYDDKYRSIQSTSDNSAGGKDRITKVLTFDGKPTAEYHSHTSNVYTTVLVTTKTYTYDHADRVLKITHQLGTGETVTLVENSYNELGQLLNKKLHQSASHPEYLQKLDYAYNIRGWLNGVNQPYTSGTGYDETDLFNFKLNYNTTELQGGSAQYNGNIAEQVWKGGYDEYVRGYKYGYDKANRLKTSDYGFKYTNSSNQDQWDFSMRYNEIIGSRDQNGNIVDSYDHNGNIKNLTRYHGSLNIVDQLHYSYLDPLNSNVDDGNHLHRVTDDMGLTVNAGFFDYEQTNGDYWYDDNGNMTIDYNKSATITYNHLNLPSQVDMYGKGSIVYSYDAAGNKLQKTVTDISVSPNKITITKYAGAFVYTNSYLAGATPIPTETLEFIGHEEGRIRPAKIDPAQPLTAANTKYIYDYFMKDHLGNTRMVLTTEQQTDIYAATQEPANATKENQLFNNLTNTQVSKSSIETVDKHFDNEQANTNVTRLNGNDPNRRVGPSIILKVMAGDIISISAKSWYKDATQPPVSGLTDAIHDQLLPLLRDGMIANDALRHGSVPFGDANDGSYYLLYDFLNNYQPYNSSRPKAFLNWMIVDEEFKKVNSSLHMGAAQVQPIYYMNGEMAKPLIGLTDLTVRRNGWLYVYLSNESNQDVYFDDLVVNHKRGPAIEQNAYYPFGLEIPGLASKAIGFGESPQNRKKFNGIEHDADLDLNIDEAFYRDYDSKIGRFWQVDPKIDGGYENISPYSSMHNNPILITDPFGDFDDYKLKRDGNIEFVRRTDDEVDKLYATNQDGSINKDKSIDVHKGVLDKKIETPPMETPYAHTTLTDNFNKREARNLFEFLANNSDVEWGLITNGQKETGRDVVGTRIFSSHERIGNEALTKVIKQYLHDESNRTMLEMSHSHKGSNADFPSGFHPDGSTGITYSGDREAAHIIETQYSKNYVLLSIYNVNTSSYIYYSSQTFIK